MQEKKQYTIMTLDDLSAIRGLGASSILVFMALRIYGGKNGQAWPSQERISNDLNMPLPTVRKAFAALRKKEFIVLDGKAKTKKYRVMDISNMDIPDPDIPNADDTNSDIQTDQIGYLDIPDRILTDTNSGPQTNKEHIKENIHLITKLNSTKTDLIIDTEEPQDLEEVEVKIQYPNVISFEEVRKIQDSFIAKKGGSEEPALDELDLLFVKLWERHSVTQNWVAERSPVQDFQKIRSGLGRTQIVKGLKELDVYIDGLTVKSDKWSGLRWFDGMRSWLQKRPDTWTPRDAARLSKAIHVTPTDVDEYNKRIQESKEQEQEQAARNMSGSRARDLWAKFVSNHPDQEQRVSAIQKERIYADFDLCEQIKQDPDLAEFAMIVSTHMDLAALGIIK